MERKLQAEDAIVEQRQPSGGRRDSEQGEEASTAEELQRRREIAELVIEDCMTILDVANRTGATTQEVKRVRNSCCSSSVLSKLSTSFLHYYY